MELASLLLAGIMPEFYKHRTQTTAASLQLVRRRANAPATSLRRMAPPAPVAHSGAAWQAMPPCGKAPVYRARMVRNMHMAPKLSDLAPAPHVHVSNRSWQIASCGHAYAAMPMPMPSRWYTSNPVPGDVPRIAYKFVLAPPCIGPPVLSPLIQFTYSLNRPFKAAVAP